MMFLKKINSHQEEELEKFWNTYCFLNKSGPNLSIDYLHNVSVFGFYIRGILVSGFCLSKPPMRIINVLTDSEQRIVSNLINEKIEEAGELSCVWIDNSVRGWKRIFIWLGIFLTAAFTLKSRIMLFGSNSSRLDACYQKFSCPLVFEKKSPNGGKIKIYMSSRKNLARALYCTLHRADFFKKIGLLIRLPFRS